MLSRVQTRALALCVLGVLCGGSAVVVRAQFQMPDMKEMSGIPRPVTDLPNGSVSVRVIRGDLSNNITNHPVEIHVGSKVVTARTDEAGRAQFDNLTPGSTMHAVTTVDGERLESQEFPAPAQGGIRLILVATDKSKAPAVEPNAPPITGQVVLGAQSRIILEPGDESVELYYLLEIVNNARAPVNTPTLFMFDMPTGAVGTTIMEGSSPLASVNGPRVQVQGPFPPGKTVVQVACNLPVSTGSLDVTQRFPATLEQVAVVVKKVGSTVLASPNITNQQEMPLQGEAFIAATGGPVAAGQPLSLTLTGLPHHNPAPRRMALALAGGVILAGMWWTTRAPKRQTARAAERKRLVARREKLLNELVRLEQDRRSGRFDERRYRARREDLMAALEQVYGALDEDGSGPEPADRAGLAA